MFPDVPDSEVLVKALASPPWEPKGTQGNYHTIGSVLASSFSICEFFQLGNVKDSNREACSHQERRGLGVWGEAWKTAEPRSKPGTVKGQLALTCGSNLII